MRLSLGGVRDEAEMRGHRRTYIGAFPGQIIQMMKKAGSRNPVFLLDEVDKMSMDFRGDPSAALLEVLDPEQNHTFTDHYLDVEYDLSSVFFIATANVLHTIPQPLQDRIEVLRMPGLHRAREDRDREAPPDPQADRVARPRAATTSPSPTRRCSGASSAATRARPACATWSARSRRCSARSRARWCSRARPTRPRSRDDNLSTYLGVPRYRASRQEERNEIGTATGLAWTEVGGEILPIEVTLMTGKGSLTLTGKLGDVMQESAQAAMSWVRSRSDDFGPPEGLPPQARRAHPRARGRHPQGRPLGGHHHRDGARLGALASVPVRRDVAMTGEITLRGKVLPIGGVKEKLLAAHRIGVTTIILPRENEKDLADIPKVVLDTMTVELVEHVDEVLKIALVPPDSRRCPVEPADTPGRPRSAA